MVRRAGGAVVLAAAFSLLIAAGATAATRYAAPRGTGKDPCADPARPCSVFTAADRAAPRSTLKAGDVVELAPGAYHAEIEGEFGYIATVSLPEGVIVRGEPGKARPVIVLRANETGDGAFSVPTGTEVANLEIRNRSRHGSAIDVAGGIVERVIARSRVGNTPTCYFVSGIMRSSACINSGGGAAIGTDVLPGDSISRSFIRNSTLVATGPGSIGMQFIYYAGKAEINAIGVLVKGEAKDVVARAVKGDTAAIPGFGPRQAATVKVELQASSYATVETEPPGTGRASITPPGTNGNVTTMPLLADGNLHQLPGSPTIDKGRSTTSVESSTSTDRCGRWERRSTSEPTSSHPLHPLRRIFLLPPRCHGLSRSAPTDCLGGGSSSPSARATSALASNASSTASLTAPASPPTWGRSASASTISRSAPLTRKAWLTRPLQSSVGAP